MTMILAVAAFLLLAAGTYRPSEILFGRVAPPRRRRGLLACGYALILVSLGLALRGADAARNAISWFGELSLAALLVVGALWAIARRRAR